MQPWRIGGKASSSSTTATLDVSRTVYTATPMEDEIESIKLYIGDVTVNTISSVKLTVSSKADFSSITDEITESSPSASSTLTFSPTSGTNWDSNLYYKFTINATLKGKSNTYVQFSKVEFYEYTDGGSKTSTSTAVSAPVGFVTDLNGSTGVSAGTLTATVTPEGESALSSPAITWSSDNTSVATVNSSTGAVTLWAVGSANIKATYAGDEDYSGSNGSYALTVTNSNPGDGSLSKPYTVAEALALISGYSSGSGSSGSVYTKGKVSSIGSIYNSTMLTYFISIDGTSSNTIQVFRGKNIGNTDFASTSDISVGDELIIYGQLYNYNSTPEINTGNYIYSLNGKIKPTITFGEDSYEVAYNGSLTISATSSPSGTITYSSSDTDIAEINSSTGVVTPKTEGEVTIRATLAEGAGNIEWYEEVTLNVTDGRASAGIEFANATVTKTWGESFSGQGLTNPNDLTVSYVSTVPAVATVNASTGAVTIVKAGTSVIKATFEGDEDYMPAEVSYTLTVNKAAAGLSFDETAFDIDLNDDSFVAPTLNNPNGLTVAWESNNTDVATVNASTGALTLITTAEGTVTIKASFTTNDWYLAGNASYTITITDPNKKGTKRNPYTVADVIDGTATGTNIYVVGFIVGNYSTTAVVNPATGDTNLSLADASDETTISNTIPIELPNKGTMRTNWGPLSNYVIGYKVLLKGNKDTYFSVNGIKGTSEISAVSVPAVVTAAGYATFAAKAAVDFTGKEIKAYVAEPNGTTGVTFTQVNKIPANTGVLLYKAGGATEEIPVTTESTDYLGNNVFVPGTGIAVASVIETTKHNYILNNKGGAIGFYRANGRTVAKNRAYIQIDESIWGSSNVKEFIALPGFDETGIEAIDSLTPSPVSEGSIFNLAGQRLSKMQKGVNIVNGKKVVIK